MKGFKSGVALLSVSAMFTSLLPAFPAAMAAEGDAEVAYFRQLRCNNGKSGIAQATGETFCSSGYLIDILNGQYMSTYDADPDQAEYSIRDSAELKTSAREYALMRIVLNSENTSAVNVEFGVDKGNVDFEAYSYNNEFADWTTELPMTDYNHVPNTSVAADITYAASLASGHDWSGNNGDFAAAEPAARANSGSEKLMNFELTVSDEDIARGYVDFLIMNAASADDATKIKTGTVSVTTVLDSEATTEPTAEVTTEPTAGVEPTAEVTKEPTTGPTTEPTPATTSKPLSYNKLDMTDKVIYTYNISSKDKHTQEAGGEVNIVDATRSESSNRTLTDGDVTTIYSTGQSDRFASVIDFGANISVSKIVVKDVSSSAIIGLAGDEGASENGVLTSSSISLKKNWARLNDSDRKNLTAAITVEYSGKNADGRYETVTLSGDFGSSRYLVLDGNGSTTRCGEIEVYYDGEYIAEPTAKPTEGPIAFDKLDMTDKGLYTYSISSKDKHTQEAGGEVNIVDAAKAEAKTKTLIDGDVTTLYSTGQGDRFASVIDFGANIPVSRIVLKDISSSAIIGLAGNAGESANGVVTDNSISLKKNWARINNSNTKNLTSAITVEYSSKNADDRYETVTLSGEFGNSRYLVLDGNGSTTRCGEIEVYYNGKALTPSSLRIDGEDSWIIHGDAEADYETSADAYRAVLMSDMGMDIAANAENVTWSVSGSDYISMKASGSVMVADKAMPMGEQTITLTAKYQDENGIGFTASKIIKVVKRAASIPASVVINGEGELNLLVSQLPYEGIYNASVFDQFGSEISDADINWSVSGDRVKDVTIDNGKLIIGKNAQSAVITITAKSAVNDAAAAFDVELVISKYPSRLYPMADVLFRSGNTDTKNVSGPDMEIRNLTDSDRGFSGAMKFDISTLKEAVKEGYPIDSINIRFATSISNDGKLMLKPLANSWDETDSTLNSFANKSEIINAAIAADSVVNAEDGVFTLSRMTKGKRIYEGERGDNESIASWQTVVDVKDYIISWINANPEENEISFMLTAGYNGTAANTVFSKDIDKSYANYGDLVNKFPELANNLSELYPTLMINYSKETVVISGGVDTIPIPSGNEANTTKLSAVHFNPFTNESDENITWSVSRFIGTDGSEAEPEGISIDNNGVFNVTKDAKPGTVFVKAASKLNGVIWTEKEITVAALAAQLINGSFENTDDAMMPKGWNSYDPAIDSAHNGIQRYQMDQASENMLANFQKSNDTDGYLSGSHSAEDPTGLYGKKTVKLTGARGIDKDYEGRVYTNNTANSSSDGGPDIRVTSGITYWVAQDYHLDEFYQLNSSSMAGPYVGYEGFQGTTGKSNQFSGSWYIKDGSASKAYTTSGYDTLRKQITVPQNVDRLRINWGLSASEGSVYYHNFRIAPQGIDNSKTAVDGNNVLKVTGNMSWTSDGITVASGKSYTYKLSVMTEADTIGNAEIIFRNSEGAEISTEKISVESVNKWTEKIGEVIVPAGCTYAELKLTNGAGSGDVWYDNIILTETSSPVVTYVSIADGADIAVAPLKGETANRYQYTAKVSDQYNNPYDGNVEWTLDKKYDGVSIRSNGALVIDDNAQAGTIVIRATAVENNAAYAEKTVTILKQSEGGSVVLKNGSFAEYDKDTMLPADWTNNDRRISTTNDTFDSSISGWKANTTTYTVADNAPVFTWDSEVDHTGNSGGSARIYNADRAQGSMQVSQNLSIQGGNVYNISLWVKTDHVSEDSNIYATLIFYDENGSTVEENKQLLVFYPSGDSSGNCTSDWKKISGSIYANPRATKLRIDMRYRGGANNRKGTVWFDDLEITKQAGIDESAVYNGKPSLMLAGYGAEEGDVSRTYGEKWESESITGITSGQKYSYAAQVQTFNANKGAYLMATYYDELGRVLASDKTAYTTDTSWSELRGSSVAPINASYAVMSLCIDGSGKAWFADAAFTSSSNAGIGGMEIVGAESAAIPSKTQYTVRATDLNGNVIDTLDIHMKAECPQGVSFDSESGILEVSASAKENETIKISAEYNGLTAEKTVNTLAAVTSISIDGSSSITIPSSGSTSRAYNLLNQLGQKIDASQAVWSVSSSGVSVENGVLTISKNASVQTITIRAEYNGLKAEKKVKLTATESSSGSGGS
ncbi:MAG: hypothetical protein Q4G33_03470, partial [bacterium]|nr:hypothetical protein [bacterium]